MGASRIIVGRNLRTAVLWTVFLVTVGLCLAVLTIVNYRFSETNPGGNDFLARWMGARYTLQGIQPYDERVALETQLWIYGHPADPEKGEDLSRFAYPLYALIFFTPFALFDFLTARALWMTLLEMGTIAFALLTAAIGGWVSHRGKVAAWIIFSLIGYFGFRALINGNPIVLVSLFLAAALLLFRKGHPLPAGIAMAFVTIKPQIAVFPILWLVVWCLFRKRFTILAFFGAAMVVMISVCTLLVPDWLLLNIHEILDYPAYTQPGTPSAVLGVWFGNAGRTAGWILSLALLAAVLGIWVRNRSGSIRSFLLVMGVTISAAPLLGVPFDPGNEYLLLLPLAILLSAWKGGSWKSILSWGCALGVLFIGFWAVFLMTLEKGSQPVQHPVLLFPLPLLLLTGFTVFYLWKKEALLAG
jgi:hypothetical protein